MQGRSGRYPFPEDLGTLGAARQEWEVLGFATIPLVRRRSTQASAAQRNWQEGVGAAATLNRRRWVQGVCVRGLAIERLCPAEANGQSLQG